MSETIYVASSWRNSYYPDVVDRLRGEGHKVYDFRNPPHGGGGFTWRDIDQAARNLRKTHCANGHERTAENTYFFKSGRRCRVCRAARDARSAA